MAIPAGTKFHGVASTVNTTERGSDFTNARRNAYNIEEIKQSPITSPAGQNLKLDASTAIVEVEGDSSGSLDGKIQLNCSQNSHGQKVSSQPHSQAASNTLLLPGGTTIGNSNATLVSDTGIQTLSNKSFAGGLQLQVYADTTARDAGITSPLAGMIVFLSDGGGGSAQFQGYNGAAWVSLN
jgi:hypothetical protein